MDELEFNNTAYNTLPIDPIRENYIRTVKGACFSEAPTTPLKGPILIAKSDDALCLLGIETVEDDELVRYFSGNECIPGSVMLAHCYCGHQFGSFAGQLGDGRAIYLGEVVNKAGQKWEMQLKGAGKTPYSRSADGRAVLRSSIREFLCSEAMYYLGVPTTRAGTLITSNSYCERDPFYSGETIMERCSVVLRIAPSFIRFGSFEIFKQGEDRSGPSVGLEDPLLFKLLDYTIENSFSEIHNMEGVSKEDKYFHFFEKVVDLTAKMVADWQCVGFAHGVMNTDNLSILGITIDYGPFGFLDAYNPEFICNGSDHGGRYAFGEQPSICQWNLKKLSEAISHALPKERSENLWKNTFSELFETYFFDKMSKKLGLLSSNDNDRDLISNLLKILTESGGDMTNIFRNLTQITLDIKSKEAALEFILSQISNLEKRAESIKPLMTRENLKKLMYMLQVNAPILMAYGIDPDSILKEKEKYEIYDEMKQMNEEEYILQCTVGWESWINDYQERLLEDCQNIGLESDAYLDQHFQLMNANNPSVILRNYMAEDAIKLAEGGDFSGVNRLLEVLRNPYEDVNDDLSIYKFNSLPPEWAQHICVTCSS
eukprot:TRINITY_DN7400_c0_g2_i1.p1 TRINITY_DN7400_c0_g2~~TRINITY_DN7400_c0_g2_i1.p1  ORF type:complete len:612 (-),score=130.97 TRINITY_DN7400_c0_g2_i1:159-1958(-)